MLLELRARLVVSTFVDANLFDLGGAIDREIHRNRMLTASLRYLWRNSMMVIG